jgi:fumarate reductase flavoprotein subunit
VQSGKHIKFSGVLCLLVILINGCDTSTSPAASTLYNPGTYIGEARGQIGRIKAEVTFSEDAIENIDLIECYESVDMFDEVKYAVTFIPAAIVDQQTLLIDVISGATVASNAILKAVEDCVRQAGGDEAVAKLKESGTAKAIAGYLGH